LRITPSAQNVSLSNLTFTDNSSNEDGGGLYIKTITGGISIIDSVFQNNSGSYGGGAYLTAISGGDVAISRNVFSQNTGDSGGGLYLNGQHSVSTVSDNIFAGNTAGGGSSGGGLFIFSNTDGSSKIVNNTFYGNTAGWYGGGALVELADETSQTDIYNNIFRDNTANHDKTDNDGDDLFVNKISAANPDAVVNLYNNDFSGNADFSTGQSEDLNITYTENYNHASNLQTDPRFVDAAGGDFHLRGDSPMIDSGSEAITLPATDFEGDDRVLLDTVDIGADEALSKSDQDDPTSPIPTVNEWGMIILLLLASLTMATRKKSFF
jgi:predicted outer membrane repeat protein